MQLIIMHGVTITGVPVKPLIEIGHHLQIGTIGARVVVKRRKRRRRRKKLLDSVPVIWKKFE